MGSSKVTARRAEDNSVVYDREAASNQQSNSVIGRMIQSKQGEADAAALNRLHASEEAAIRQKTESIKAGLGGIAGSTSVSTSGTGAGYASATNTTAAGNPGQSDTQSQGDVDLSTSDNTARRKAGYRRDSGIRI